jgi:nucleoside-diphosphate-sugar epimerase
MRVLVIGGTGHIGSALVPQLVEAGHQVVSVSRGVRSPYAEHAAWTAVEQVTLARDQGRDDGFGAAVAALDPAVVVDLICYTPESAASLAGALHGRVEHFLHCGTIWVHGHGIARPTTEAEPRRPLGDYGRRKAAIERLLFDAHGPDFPVTVIHPGHLVGRGWFPINPAANFNPEVFADLAAGRRVRLPHFGMETVHHVHVADVAQAFVLAIGRREAAAGESFHAVSPGPLTLRGYAEAMAAAFGRELDLALLPWAEWRAGVSARDAAVTEDHLRHSPHCSIEKARVRLGYAPRYTSLQAVQEAVSGYFPCHPPST